MDCQNQFKPALIWNPRIPLFNRVAGDLVVRYGNHPRAEANVILGVGGDGSAIYALHGAHGIPVYAIAPEDSDPERRSVGYTCNRYDPHEDLSVAVAQSESFKIYPVKATVHFKDGSQESFTAFSSFELLRANGQAAMLKLTGHFNGMALTQKLMGTGLVFSTPMGSTATNYSNDGPTIPMGGPPQMILSDIGIKNPAGFNHIVSGPEDYYEVECAENPVKRPLAISVDGQEIGQDKVDNPACRVEVRLSPQAEGTLLIKKGSLHPFRRWQPTL